MTMAGSIQEREPDITWRTRIAGVALWTVASRCAAEPVGAANLAVGPGDVLSVLEALKAGASAAARQRDTRVRIRGGLYAAANWQRAHRRRCGRAYACKMPQAATNDEGDACWASIWRHPQHPASQRSQFT